MSEFKYTESDMFFIIESFQIFMEKVQQLLGDFQQNPIQKIWMDFKKQLKKQEIIECSSLFSYANSLKIENYTNSPMKQADLANQNLVQVKFYQSPISEEKQQQKGQVQQFVDQFKINLDSNEKIQQDLGTQINFNQQKDHQIHQNQQIWQSPQIIQEKPKQTVIDLEKDLSDFYIRQQNQEKLQSPPSQIANKEVEQNLMERKEFKREGQLRKKTRNGTLNAKDDTNVPSKPFINLQQIENTNEMEKQLENRLNFLQNQDCILEKQSSHQITARVEAQDFLKIQKDNSSKNKIQKLGSFEGFSKIRNSFQGIDTSQMLSLIEKGIQIFQNNSQTIDLIHNRTLETTTFKNSDEKSNLKANNFGDQIQIQNKTTTLKGYSIFAKNDNKQNIQEVGNKIQEAINQQNKVYQENSQQNQARKIYQLN